MLLQLSSFRKSMVKILCDQLSLDEDLIVAALKLLTSAVLNQVWCASRLLWPFNISTYCTIWLCVLYIFKINNDIIKFILFTDCNIACILVVFCPKRDDTCEKFWMISRCHLLITTGVHVQENEFLYMEKFHQFSIVKLRKSFLTKQISKLQY